MNGRTPRIFAAALAYAAAAFGSHLVLDAQQARPATTARNAVPGSDWPTYGHDPGGMRYSPLTQLTPANVAQLQPAWVYHMKPAAPANTNGAIPANVANTPVEGAPQGRAGRGGGGGFASGETTPPVIGSVMYVSTPYGRVVALEPATGKEVWAYRLPEGNPATRGVEYFPGDAQTPPQIVFGSSDGKLYSLDAKSGVPNKKFGDEGVVDLNTPEILQGLPGNDGLSSPPIVYKNLVLTGGRTQKGPAQCPAGDVRAWDLHNGSLVWTFHSVPRKGEPFNDTWDGDSWVKRSGVNVWGLMTGDVARGIVYMPFGATATDRYGGDRPGDNLFSSSVVAADANTGKYLWHFQVVHHDIWDADVANPPILLDVKKDGKTIPAVGIMSKSGLVFLMDRVTGKSIYGVEERPVPQSEVPLERTAKTQPFPLKPPPLSRMTMSAADLATVTPELEAACKELIYGVQMGGPYLPPAYMRLRVQFPGNHGGVNWYGTSFNPQLGYLFVNTNELGQLSGLRDHDPRNGPAGGNGVGNRVAPGGPYEGVPDGGRFSIRGVDAQQLPCQEP